MSPQPQPGGPTGQWVNLDDYDFALLVGRDEKIAHMGRHQIVALIDGDGFAQVQRGDGVTKEHAMQLLVQIRDAALIAGYQATMEGRNR